MFLHRTRTLLQCHSKQLLLFNHLRNGKLTAHYQVFSSFIETKPKVSLPSYIRLRDLAKKLQVPIQPLLKLLVKKNHRKYYMTVGSDKLVFKQIKDIIVPYHVASDVARSLSHEVTYENLDPELTDFNALDKNVDTSLLQARRAVVAVMGHVDHGKTTLMDTLRQSNIAKTEAFGITQKINICEAKLSNWNPPLQITFLDTPGHFHFFRMRSMAAQVADLILLVIAADEGCCLQTDESIGAIEETGIPTVVVINKIDLLAPKDVDKRLSELQEEIRMYVALQNSPIVAISASTGLQMDQLKGKIHEFMMTKEMSERLTLYPTANSNPLEMPPSAEGIVLESVQLRGKGIVLRVLLKRGELRKGQHFAAGFTFGLIRQLWNSDGERINDDEATPGRVINVGFRKLYKTIDAPMENYFFVFPEEKARRIVEQRHLAVDYEECIVNKSTDEADENEFDGNKIDNIEEVSRQNTIEEESSIEQAEENDEVDYEHYRKMKYLIIKADGAGSLVSIQDTVDELKGVRVAKLGIGAVTTSDIEIAIHQGCPIFGFNIKLKQREAKFAALRGIRVVLFGTIHELIAAVEEFQQS